MASQPGQLDASERFARFIRSAYVQASTMSILTHGLEIEVASGVCTHNDLKADDRLYEPNVN